MAPSGRSPGRTTGSGTQYATRSAIGVTGNQIIDPTTGQIVGYQGYTAEHPAQRVSGLSGAITSGQIRLPSAIRQAYQPQQVVPKYFDGDQHSPSNLPTDQMIQLQESMAAAGLYGDNQYQRGVWTSVDSDVYEELLSLSNRTGVDKDEMLGRIVAGGGIPKKGKTRDPISITLTSPDDISAAIDDAAQKLYGGRLSDEQLQQFVSTYHSMQTQAQTAAQNANYEGGTTVANPSLETAAEKAIKEAHPAQVFTSALGENLRRMTPAITQPGGGWL